MGNSKVSCKYFIVLESIIIKFMIIFTGMHATI